MECHKREFVAAAQSQGTQLDPSLLVNEGSQAEQIEAGDVCCRAISMSKGFWLNHVEPNVFDRVFEDYLWLQKMVQISTFHWSTKISQAFRGSFPLGQNQGDLVVCFFQVCTGAVGIKDVVSPQISKFPMRTLVIWQWNFRST